MSKYYREGKLSKEGMTNFASELRNELDVSGGITGPNISEDEALLEISYSSSTIAVDRIKVRTDDVNGMSSVDFSFPGYENGLFSLLKKYGFVYERKGLFRRKFKRTIA